MDSVAARNIGMIKSSKYSNPLVSLLPSKTLVFSPDFLWTPMILLPWPPLLLFSLYLYVDDFICFLANDLFAECCKLDFMGVIEWFLGIHFSWRITLESVMVHLKQLGHTANLIKSFSLHNQNQTLAATPYCSRIPINAIAPPTDDDDSPSQICHWEAYQSLVGSIGWLSCSTRPILTAIHSFLSSYSNKPLSGRMKAALYVLHYIHSTHNYGILFTSDNVAPMHSYVRFPPSTNVQAYNDMVPPKLGSSSTLSAIAMPAGVPRLAWLLPKGLSFLTSSFEV
jgi:hypothetical protein